jgi:hypothetical protein
MNEMVYERQRCRDDQRIQALAHEVVERFFEPGSVLTTKTSLYNAIGDALLRLRGGK